MNVQLSLLDVLACRAGCSLLSDLRHLDWLGRGVVIHALEGIPPENASLKEWNDALQYLTGAPPEKTAGAARDKLLELLSH